MKTAYTEINTDEIINLLKEKLTPKRFAHSLVTAEQAAKLAKNFGVDDKKAYIAGLVHDCAKCMKPEEMLMIADIMGIDENEKNNFKILHAPVGAYVAKQRYGITDEEILSSIRWHTLGKCNMTDFEKIIYLADKVEPLTRESSHFLPLEECLKVSLDEAMLQTCKQTLKSLVERSLPICMHTVEVYNYYLTVCERK